MYDLEHVHLNISDFKYKIVQLSLTERHFLKMYVSLKRGGHGPNEYYEPDFSIIDFMERFSFEEFRIHIVPLMKFVHYR